VADDFSRHMQQVALEVLPEFFGEPNKHMSSATELRWGKHGSFAVDLAKGTWFDHEDQTGGGVLDLLKAYRGLSKREAVQWMQDQGFVQPNGAVQGEKFAGFLDEWPVATYDYFDHDGNFAYQVLKFPKTARARFMQRRRAPDGGWIWGLRAGLFGKTRSGDWFKAKVDRKYVAEQHFGEAPHFLYRGDEVREAIKAKRPIILCEGEKDVETLRSWGLVGTTNQGGGGNWFPELTGELTGADVILLPDNDKTGRQRVITMGAELSSVAKRVRVLDIAEHWPTAPEKADVTDWKEKASGDLAQFTALVKKAPLWVPELPESPFEGFDFDDMDSVKEEQDYIIDGWLTTGGRSVVGGPSKSGKTFFALHAAMCIARGVPWFSYPVKKTGVLYQAGEAGRGIKGRLVAYRRHFMDENPTEKLPLRVLTSRVNLYAKDGDTKAMIDEIKARKVWMKARYGVDLGIVFIDTLNRASAGASENDGKDMGIVFDNVAKIQEQCDVAVVLVHHMNAKGEKLRGHSSIYADSDQVILVTADEETKVKSALLDKQKDDEDGIAVTFRLWPVEIGVRRLDPSKPKTSCVVIAVTERDQLVKEKERQGFVTNPTQYRVLTHLFNAIDRHGRLVIQGEQPQEAIGKVVVDWKAFIDVVYEATPPGKTKEQIADALAKAFERKEVMSLMKGGVLGFKKPYLWWAGRPVKDFSRTFPKSEIPPKFPRNSPDNPPSPAVEELLDVNWEMDI
jgi:5S rRNA maturation endonuclease (ribonuclease M5)